MATKSNDDSANIFEQIRENAHQFRRLLSQGKMPRIERFLNEVAEEGREDLFTQLLEIEVNFRRSKGQVPATSEYLKRFSQYQKQVRRVFFEPTMGSVDSSTGSEGSSQTASRHSEDQEYEALAPTYEFPDANRLGDYHLLRKLGQGGMGVVYEARHSDTNNRVALKTLPTGGDGQQVNADKLYRFRKEFRRLSEINHPNLVGMQSLEVDGDRWFFTMDLIDGEDFLTYVRPNDQLDENRLRACLKQLATGVLELHRRGIIHRDLKPSNIIVSSEGHLSILDFGLAAQLQRPGDVTFTRSGMFAGTPPYAAPEQMFGERTEASDWYAFGTMLYEALIGERPFKDPDPMVLLRRKQEQDPPSLVDREEIPRDLSELADGLLRREPGLRLSSQAISEKLKLQEETRVSSSTRDSHGSSSPSVEDEDAELDGLEEEIVLIGRDKQLAELESIKRDFLELKEPRIVWVTGLSGEGKSSLIEKFLRPLRDNENMLVLAGRCYDRESVPFKAIDSLIDTLVSSLRKLSSAQVRNILPDDIHTLAQLFPVLRRVPAVSECAVGNLRGIDDRQIRVRAFSAFREMLLRLTESTPVTLFIDDLQWGDNDSADVLFDLLSPPDPPKIMLLGSYRTDEADDSPFLREWKRLCEQRGGGIAEHHIRVAPLTEDQCLELVASRIGISATDLRTQAKQLYADAHGNPYFIEQLVEGFDAETGRFEAVPLHEIIRRRLKRLHHDAISLLEVISTAGQALSLDEAFRAAGCEKSAHGTISHMCSERLVRLIGSGRTRLVDTYHDKIRETVLAKLSAQNRQLLHLKLAHSIESEHGTLTDEQIAAIENGDLSDKTPLRLFDLAYHFCQAGDEKRTLAYAVLAARQARSQLALDVLLEHLETASRADSSASDKLLFHIAKEAGEALMFLGRYDDALTKFDAALRLAENDYDRALVECFQGETHHRNGQFKQSITCMMSALDQLGFRVPRSTLGLAVGALREVLVQCFHTLVPQRLYRREEDREGLLVIRSLNWLAQQTIFENTFKPFYMNLAALNRAERYPISTSLAHSSAFHGVLMSMVGWHKRGSQCLSLGLEYAKKSGDVWAIGFAENCVGFGSFFSGDFNGSKSILDQALLTFGESSDVYVVGFTRFHRGYSHYLLGDLSSAITDANGTFNIAAEIGDSRTMCASWLWGRATKGNFPFDELRQQIPDRPDDVMSTVHARLAEGIWHSYHGRTLESLNVIESAAQMVNESLCINGHTFLVMPMLVRALRLRAVDLRQSDPQSCEKMLRRSLKLAKRGARFSALFPTARAFMLREMSEIQRETGRLRSALKSADKSCNVAERQQAPYELAQSKLLRCQVARKLELPGADEQLQAAELEMQRFDEMIRQARESKKEREPNW